jgi:flagellar L-ring protein precursor FlgH
MRRSLLLLAAPALLLAGCGSIAEVATTPKMTAMAYPAPLVPARMEVMQREAPVPASANSLWRTGARAFFHDQRASRVGDILTVQIDISDSAKVQNSTSTSRKSDNTLGAPHVLGLESTIGKILPKAFDPSNAISTASENRSDGAGSVNRSETISLTIAAIVTALMPNGNLVIEGRQETRINSELRELTIAGIVRPEDITSANTIRHTQIAEARISYGGRGDLSRVQKTPVGTALAQKFSPF